MDRIAHRCLIGNAFDELEELGRVDDRVRNPGSRNDLLLGLLRAEVASRGLRGIAVLPQLVVPDDPQRDVVPDSGGALGSEKVVGRPLEELERRRVLEGGRVGYVDNDGRAFERCGEPLAGDRVDPEPG